MENPVNLEQLDEHTRFSLLRIEELFTSLTEEVPKNLFKELKLPVLKLIDTTGWSKSRRLFYKLSSPFYDLVVMKWRHSPLLGFLWVISSFIWYAFLIVTSNNIYSEGKQINSAGGFEISVENLIILFFTIVATILIPLSYWRIIEFLRDTRLPLWFRICWVLLELFCLSGIFYARIVVPSQHSLLILLSSTRGIAYLAIIILMAWFPLFNYVFGNLWDVGAGGVQLFYNFFERIFKMHRPFNSKVVLAISTSPISYKTNPLSKWKLVELTMPELKTIREWANANRENTEKKFTPTLVTVAVIGVFSNTETFNKIITGLLNSFRDAFSQSPFGSVELFINYFTVFLILILISIFMLLLIVMFENLIVQGMIIEACTVALFVKDDFENTQQMKVKAQKSLIKNFLDYFMK